MSDYRYAVPSAIRRLLGTLGTEENVSDEELWDFCGFGDDYVVANLLDNYVGESAFADTPWAGIPFRTEESLGKGRLSGGLIAVASDAVTDQWEVVFTTSSAFAVTAYYGGAQGTGNKSSDFTSSDSKIQIPSTAWLEADKIMARDKFKFATFNVFRLLTALATRWALSEYLHSEFVGEIPNAEEQSGKWVDKVNAILENMQGEHPKVKLSSYPSLDLDPIGLATDIDDYGRDLTDHEDNEMQ